MPVSLRLFLSTEFDSPLSLNGDFSNYDNGIYNGSDGENQVEQMWVANLQTDLARDLSVDGTAVFTTDLLYGPGDILALSESEAVLILGYVYDGGDTGYQVIRGFVGTTAEDHTTSSSVIAAYDYTNAIIKGFDTDTSAGDEADWLRVSAVYYDPDASEWDSTNTKELVIPELAYNDYFTFYRNIRVPSGQGAYYKTDLRWRVEATRFVHDFSS